MNPQLSSEAVPISVPISTERGQPSPRKQKLLLTMLLVVSTLAVYSSSLRNDFVSFDDPAYVTKNAHVLRGISWENIGWAFRTTQLSNWHPFTWISHMTDVQLFGLNPAGHHLMNALLHALNVALLFLLLEKATGYLLRSAVVAALFAFHPLNVESVAWISERKNLLCTSLMLLALCAYGWYVRRPGIAHYGVLVLCFALSLMAKPMSITLPFALLLLDYWPLQRLPVPLKNAPQFGATLLKLTVEKTPLFLLSGASALLTIWSQKKGGSVPTISELPLPFRINNAIYSYIEYMWKGIWPMKLAAFYPHPEGSLLWWKVVAVTVFLMAVTMLVWNFRERRYLLTGWLWYVGTMVPMIGIVQVGRQALADRYAYITFLGVFVIAVWLAAEVVARINISRAAIASITLAVLFGYATVAFAQISYWRNSYILFAHTLAVAPNNGFAEAALGTALLEDLRRPDLAMQHFEAAVRISPDLYLGHLNLATLLEDQNQFDRAIRENQLALDTATNTFEAAQVHNNVGVILMKSHRTSEAVSEFNLALRLDPEHQTSYLARGAIEYEQGRIDAALADFTQATQLGPSPFALVWLGRALEAKGDRSSAAKSYQAALHLAPDYADAQNRLDAVRSSQKK